MSKTNETKQSLAQRLLAEHVKKEIKQRTAAFKAASAAGKRVLIAQDVITQLKAGKFVATEGTRQVVIPRDRLDDNGDRVRLAPIKDKDGDEDYYATDDRSVQELVLGDEVAECQCCALGGMFLSCTLFNNKTTVEEANDIDIGDGILNNEGFDNGLHKFFNKGQLMLIEVAFEVDNGGFGLTDLEDVGLTERVYERAMEFGGRRLDAHSRLLAIMNNIAKNNGEFKP